MTAQDIFDDTQLGLCISCGFCLPTCPTYQLTGDEGSSPRGRIALMRAIASGTVAIDDPTAIEQSEHCLGCRACEPVCPAGVQYGQLLEQWRDAGWKHKPAKLRALMAAVRHEAPIRAAALASNHARKNTGAGDDYLMLGCFERILFPAVSRTAAAGFPNLTVDPDQGCCGALHAHNGSLETGEEMARQLADRLPGTIVTTSGGCAAHLASVIGRDRVMEFSEYTAQRLASRDFASIQRNGRTARIAIQDSCHLRNGLGVADEIRTLVRQVGTLVELDTAGDCCGAAGSYSLLRPDDALRVLEPKLAEIATSDVDIVVVVNPGCYRHLRTHLARDQGSIEVTHIAELLAEASASPSSG
ncbi:Glycolate dehydrogenase, iron-sulfur subunit GlcF [hydrothermal vent metagenome]|uniref:Glycolate dehydrogenase, iron-sulfur subunit GlcF n=1 Tax=hydrothermal vent metagenome TaxID=652676 RepID=A0A3B0S265_9ZZZZ